MLPEIETLIKSLNEKLAAKEKMSDKTDIHIIRLIADCKEDISFFGHTASKAEAKPDLQKMIIEGFRERALEIETKIDGIG